MRNTSAVLNPASLDNKGQFGTTPRSGETHYELVDSKSGKIYTLKDIDTNNAKIHLGLQCLKTLKNLRMKTVGQTQYFEYEVNGEYRSRKCNVYDRYVEIPTAKWNEDKQEVVEPDPKVVEKATNTPPVKEFQCWLHEHIEGTNLEITNIILGKERSLTFWVKRIDDTTDDTDKENKTNLDAQLDKAIVK